MNDERTNNSTAASIWAVEQYIALKPENCNRHQAYVCVCANGKDCSSGVRAVSANIGRDTAEITIEDLHTIYGGCSNRFTAKDSSFSLICKTLQIKSENALGCTITVEITGK